MVLVKVILFVCILRMSTQLITQTITHQPEKHKKYENLLTVWKHFSLIYEQNTIEKVVLLSQQRLVHTVAKLQGTDLFWQ